MALKESYVMALIISIGTIIIIVPVLYYSYLEIENNSYNKHLSIFFRLLIGLIKGFITGISIFSILMVCIGSLIKTSPLKVLFLVITTLIVGIYFLTNMMVGLINYLSSNTTNQLNNYPSKHK